MRGDLRFVVICAALFLAGGLLRWDTGSLTVPWATAAPVVAGAAATGVLPPEAGATALEFYHALDKGRYADAYAVALENQWSGASRDTAQVTGLTSEEQFVKALNDELGTSGEGLNIISLDVLETAILPEAERSVARYPELAALAALLPSAQVEQVYQVHLGGTLLGRCSRWNFAKHVRVVQLADGKGWRVLLPGVKARNLPHNEEWFLDRPPATSS